MTTAERAALPCVQAGRAPVIVAGAVIVKAAMEALGYDGADRLRARPSRRSGAGGSRANVVARASARELEAPRGRSGGMADATVLNTVGLCPCGFESRLRHT